tara:strand:- start:1612 stop:1776 length:165 start_codon:yes stop_codon:yes gene_type:complete
MFTYFISAPWNKLKDTNRIEQLRLLDERKEEHRVWMEDQKFYAAEAVAYENGQL